MELLEKLCKIHAPSGEEYRVRDFITGYIKENASGWKQEPVLYFGDDYQDCLVVRFGKPRFAYMAHMDSVGFTAGHGNELIPIGSPGNSHNATIRDNVGLQAEVYWDNSEKKWFLKDDTYLYPGNTWTWKPDFHIDNNVISSPFLDNRLGIYTLMSSMPYMTDVAIAFSTYEEMSSGGKAGFLARVMYEIWNINQVIVTDITWVTPYVKAGQGVAISLRDVAIPRKKFRDKIIDLAKKSGIPFQVEIEKAGGSDGTTIGKGDYPVDWIFIGAPEENPHGNIEKVHIADVESMIQMHRYLNLHLK